MVGRCTRPPIFGVRTHATPSRLWQHNVMHRRPHYHAIQYVARIIAHPSVHFQPDTPNDVDTYTKPVSYTHLTLPTILLV